MLVARGPVEHDGSEVAGHVVVDSTQRRRSRFRTRTSTDEAVGVVVDAAGQLSAGDVLETDDGRRFVVELDAIEAFVVSLPSETNATELVAAGHAIGNRHWDLAARESRLYVPSGGERERRRAFLTEVLPDGSTIDVAQVEPTLFDELTPSGHEHGHDTGHAHSHGDGEAHSHAHDASHTHGDELTIHGVRQAADGARGESDE